MKFRLACADFAFPLLEHGNALKLISMLGFEGVDIGLFEGRSHLWPSREREFADISNSAGELSRKLNDLGLTPADVFLQMEPDFIPFAANHPAAERRQKARDWFLRTLEYANCCGCGHVTSLPGVHFEEEPYEDSFARCIEELTLARRTGTTTESSISGVEAHVGSIVPTSRRKPKRFDKERPGTYFDFLDYTHFTRSGLADSDVEHLLQYASHFHARGACEGRLQTSFSKNTIDYTRVASILQSFDYKGWMGIEYVYIDWEYCNECDNLSETILFRDYLRAL